jgi:hypothetical protein
VRFLTLRLRSHARARRPQGRSEGEPPREPFVTSFLLSARLHRGGPISFDMRRQRPTRPARRVRDSAKSHRARMSGRRGRRYACGRRPRDSAKSHPHRVLASVHRRDLCGRPAHFRRGRRRMALSLALGHAWWPHSAVNVCAASPKSLSLRTGAEPDWLKHYRLGWKRTRRLKVEIPWCRNPGNDAKASRGPSWPFQARSRLRCVS